MDGSDFLVSVVTRHDLWDVDSLAVLIDSLYSQDHQLWEHVIIVDDAVEGSGDVSALVDSLEDSRFRVAFTGGSTEIADLTPETYGVDLARGHYISFVPSGWYVADDYISQHLGALRQNRGVVGSVCQVLGTDGLLYHRPTSGVVSILEFQNKARVGISHVTQCMLALGGDRESLSQRDVKLLLRSSLRSRASLCAVVSAENLVINVLQEGRDLFDDVMGV